jgi:peptidoglycan/xylan/chitin deacetylase (PgdA/CDA1 family)
LTDCPPAHIKHLYKIHTVKEFERDLDFMLRFYEPLGLADIDAYLRNGKKRDKPGIYLSFDDGLSEMYDIVRPILLYKGIPAAFFCNTAFIDNRDMFYRYKISLLIDKLGQLPMEKIGKIKTYLKTKNIRSSLLHLKYKDSSIIQTLAEWVDVDFVDYLQTNRPYMSWQQLSLLKEDGFDIGAHSIDHPLYADISEDEQIIQTNFSINDLQRNINPSSRIFAFPFTEFGVNSSFFRQIEVDILFGTAGLKHDDEHNMVHRIAMEKRSFNAKSIIYHQYLYFMIKAIFYKNIRKRLDHNKSKI